MRDEPQNARAAHPKPSWRPTGVYIAKVLGLAAVYYAASEVGLSMAFVHTSVSPVWPPTGIAIGAALLLGVRVWPGIFAGALFANLSTHVSVVTAAGIATGNTLEAVVAVALVRRFVGLRGPLDSAPDILRFVVLAGLVSTMVSATIGTTTLCAMGAADWARYGTLWGTWWLGDAGGAIVVAPLLIAWGGSSYRRASISAWRLVETIAAVSLLTVVAFVVFGGFAPKGSSSYPIGYLMIPCLIWVAFTFEQRGVTATSLLLALIAVWGTLRGFGPFARGTPNESLLLLSGYIVTGTVTYLILAAVVGERRWGERRLAAQYAVARIWSESETLPDAAPRVLEAICRSLDWRFGAFWRVDTRCDVLRCEQTWHVRDLRIAGFDAASRQRTFAHGIGLPGRVWQTAEPCWISDVVVDPNFPRAQVARRAGLHAAFGFPILRGASVVGVIEFFTDEVRGPDPKLLNAVAVIGSQMGQFLERELAERALRESEDRKGAILATALDCIVTFDDDGRVVEVNPTAEQAFRYGAAEMIGLDIGDLVPVARDELPLGGRIETTAVRADGSEFPVELTMTELPSYGPPLYTAFMRDITDRQRSEREIRLLGEASEALGRSLDYDSTVAAVARLAIPRLADWCALHLGREDGTIERVEVAHVDPLRESALGAAWATVSDDALVALGPGSVLRTGRSTIVTVLEGSEHAGVARDLDAGVLVSVPVRAHGPLRGALTLARSRSGQLLDERDLRLAEELARRAALAVENAMLYEGSQNANRLKDDFLAIVSHELRTPLNAIFGWARLLRSGRIEGAKAVKALETIERNATVQAQLIEDLLDVSRIVTGKLALDVQPVDVAEIAETALDSVRLAADAKNIVLETSLDGDPAPVNGDPERLQQVVWNLLSNAVKFTSDGGRVRLSVDAWDTRVEIRVSDTGPGIDATFLPYIFDRFRQADPSTTRRHGGLGLGLAIVRNLVELHGGSVHATNNDGGPGATFSVVLPAANRVGDPEPSRHGRPVSVERSAALDGVRVIVVDDEADARELAASILETSGAEVRACASAADALREVEAWSPDAIVADIGMPGEDGYALIRTIRSLDAPAAATRPAIALTAYATAQDRDRAVEVGYDRHLAKPLEPERLVATIRELLNREGRSP